MFKGKDELVFTGWKEKKNWGLQVESKKELRLTGWKEKKNFDELGIKGLRKRRAGFTVFKENKNWSL